MANGKVLLKPLLERLIRGKRTSGPMRKSKTLLVHLEVSTPTPSGTNGVAAPGPVTRERQNRCPLTRTSKTTPWQREIKWMKYGLHGLHGAVHHGLGMNGMMTRPARVGKPGAVVHGMNGPQTQCTETRGQDGVIFLMWIPRLHGRPPRLRLFRMGDCSLKYVSSSRVQKEMKQDSCS